MPLNMERQRLDIRSRLAAARLPAIPQVLVQLIAQCEADNAGMTALAQLLANDPALSAKVLRVATSPAYHRGPHVASLERALTTIGIDMVRTLLITESVYQAFHQLGSGAGVDFRPFWRHAIATAVSARMVAEQLAYPQFEEAYLGGLLHDIGRLALVAASPDEYAVNFSAADDLGLCAREERTLEITHAEAGAWLLESLNLDSFLADSVRYHHDPLPQLAHAHPLVRIVATAELIAGAVESGQIDAERLAAQTGIDPDVLRQHGKSLAAQVEELAKLLGFDPESDAPATQQAAAANPLGDKVRDLMLVSKATEALGRQRGVDACCRAIVGASIILFDFADAILFAVAPSGKALAPVALAEGRQRLAGLSLPLEGEGIAATLATSDGVAFYLPAQQPSIAEEQLRRVLAADGLVALRLGAPEQAAHVLIGAIGAGQARHLRTRLSLLRDFGRQAGSALESLVRKEGAERAANSALVDEFQMASRRVAHEVNNPLAIIKNYLGVLQRKAVGEQGMGKDLEVLGEEIDRVAQIVSEFARSQGVAARDETDPDSALEHAARLFQESQSFNPGVRIRCTPARSPVMARISSARLNQILLNLIKNANEAMPDGGEIELRNSGVVRGGADDMIAISVSDTGPGLPEDVQAQLFTPVRSTKGGQHQGLGLSIVHELTVAAGGRISCRSGRGGTMFEILLPLAASTPLQAAS